MEARLKSGMICGKEELPMAHPRYSSQEIVRRGEELYAKQIRDRIEANHKGQFLVLDIETGDYEVDNDELAALDRAKAKHPDAALYILRVGFPAAVKLGGTRHVRGQ
jgi:hypothetical protein